MKREPSCCPLRYELPSLEFKILLCCSLQMLGFCCTSQTDVEGLAGARLTTLVSLLLMFPAHTKLIY